jgi:hypothetical protein
VTLSPGENGFCADVAATTLVLLMTGALAAGGEAYWSGSGIWACESTGGQPGDTGFLTNIPESEACFCGALVRDAIIASGLDPNTACEQW